jgi:hypothetical protein
MDGMERIADFNRVMLEAAIELQYIAADHPKLAKGLLPLAAMLEKTAQNAALQRAREVRSG